MTTAEGAETITVGELKARYRRTLAENRARAHQEIDRLYDQMNEQQEAELERLESLVDGSWLPN